jgi:aryl-phospho-beta-D-glucosidase BglC (GH1 family)
MIAANIPQLRGVNMPGANFSYLTLPPVSGTNYQFPSTEDIDYAYAKGVNYMRLLVSWEALQLTLNTALGSGSAASATYLAQMDAFVAYATGKGMYVMVEPHGAITADFAGYRGNAVGTAAVPNTAFADFWGRIASRYANNSLVMYGLSNEPCKPSEGGPTGSGDVRAWFASCNAAIAAIRAAGATQLIMVPGEQFSNASQWLSSWYDINASPISNMTGVLAITDSANNWCISAHLYLDQNQSGTGTDVGPTSTLAAAMNGITLPHASITLASATEWSANFGMNSGRVNITTSAGVQTVSFTGISGNVLTGCTGGTGTMSTGGAVTGAPFIASFLLQPLITAARSAGIRVHLSEFGVQASTAGAAAACADLLQLINANQDVMIGMAWWPLGPQAWYSGANFTLCPSQGNGSDAYATDSPQMALAQLFFQGTAQDPAQAAHAVAMAAVAAAQATANTGVTNAAAAQSTASTALANAATAQAAASAAGTAAATAQSTATAAGTAAGAAQSAANTALANAATADADAAAAQATATGAASSVAALASTVATMTPGSGSTRPTGVLDGTVFVDTTLGTMGQPIYALGASGTGWIDSSGNAV